LLHPLATEIGTKLPNRDVRVPVATGGKLDMARIDQFVRD